MDKVNQKDFIVGCNEKFKSAVDTEFRKLINVDEKRILIVYIATGKYKEYFEEFENSLENFCPGVKKKVHIFSDNPDYFFRNKSVAARSYVRNYPWPTITLFKFHYIYEAIKYAKELEIPYTHVFYFNANVEFRKVVESDLFLSDNYITVEHHTLRLECNSESRLLEENATTNQYRISESSAAYIKEDYTYVAGGMFGGPISEVKRECIEIINMCRSDLSKNIIPNWHDESYHNKFISGYPKDKLTVLTPCYGASEDNKKEMEVYDPAIIYRISDKTQALKDFNYKP